MEEEHATMAELDGNLTLSRDIRRACQLLEKLQKSKYCGEVPATKLAALQKVLQSEFLNAVREVYEHVYETVDVEGSPDIRYYYWPLRGFPCLTGSNVLWEAGRPDTNILA